MTIELLSSSDGKEGDVKAANFLFSNYLKDDIGGCKRIEPTFTETDMAAAWKAVGMQFFLYKKYLHVYTSFCLLRFGSNK